MKLDLKGFTARQYAMLIMKEDLGYSYERAEIKLGKTRYAAARLYERAKNKMNG